MKRVTIKDIAKELNIHHSTVSRAMRNDPRVKEETRNQILNYAREHNYQINLSALQLRGDKNNAIALIVPNINHSFFADIISQLTDLAFQNGYILSVFQTNEQLVQEQEIIQTIVRHNFAGVIVSITKESVRCDHFNLLQEFGIPLVFFDRVCETMMTPKVLVNNQEITAEATTLLLKKGYQRVAHVTINETINVFKERIRGYQEAIHRFSNHFQQVVVCEEESLMEAGKRIFARMCDQSDRPDAIVSSSTLLTIGILLEARNRGIKVPEELGIITFGTIPSNDIIQPSISSIEQPEAEIAEITFDLLNKMIQKVPLKNEEMNRKVNAKIILRESC